MRIQNGCDWGAQERDLRFETVGADATYPSTEEGGDAKVRSMISASGEMLCTYEIVDTDFCITKKMRPGELRPARRVIWKGI